MIPTTTTVAPPSTLYRGCGWPGSVDIRPGEATSPLMTAVMPGDTEEVAVLLESGASPDMVDGLHGTPLEFAIYANCMEMVELLLRHGAAIDSYVWQPPLYWAVSAGSRDMVELLLEAGADPSSEGTLESETALHLAVGVPRDALLELMLPFASDLDVGQSSEYGLDVPLKDRRAIFAGTPFELGAELGRIRSLEVLAGAGASVTAASVYLAIRGGFEESVTRLLDWGFERGEWSPEDVAFLEAYADAEGMTHIAGRLREWRG